MTNPARPECDTCGKVMCLDCARSQLDDEDSVFVSVDLLQRLRDGIL